jgi:hypothetical protein
MATTTYIVFQEGTDGQLVPVPNGIVEAATRDAAIAAVRTTAGTFVAILAQSLTSRTFAVPPRSPAVPKPTTPTVQ